MQNSNKKSMAITLCLLATLNNAHAQFYDLENGSINEIQNQYQEQNQDQSINNRLDQISNSDGSIQSAISNDAGSNSQINDEDLNDKLNLITYQPLPNDEGFGSFATNSSVSEEPIKEQLRNSQQLDYIGLTGTGFDEALWISMSYDEIEMKFDKLTKNKIKSSNIENILRNMLLTKARAPKTDSSWLALRMKTLLKMGYLSDVTKLFTSVKPKELILLNNNDLNLLYLKSNLLNNQLDMASFIKTLLSDDTDNVNYQKALLVNLIKEGKLVQAKLSFQALAENNDVIKSSNFASILSAIVDSSKFDASAITEDYDIFEQYLISLNPSLFENVNFYSFTDQSLYFVSQNASNKEERIRSAEVLFDIYPNSYSNTILAGSYELYNFTSQELSVPLKYIKDSESVIKNRALLYQSSKIVGLNSTKALSLKNLWQSYDKSGLTSLKLIVNNNTQGIKIDSSIAWFSKILLKNELKQENISYATIKSLYENIDNVYINSNILDLQIALEFLRQTTLLNGDIDAIQDYKDTLQAWFKSTTIKSTKDYNYVAKVLTLLDALNAPVPEKLWTMLYAKSEFEPKTKSSNAIWLRLLTSSIEKQQKGKALLLIAEVFSKYDEKDMDSQTLANIVASLNYLNMSKDMAQIGMKAIIK